MENWLISLVLLPLVFFHSESQGQLPTYENKRFGFEITIPEGANAVSSQIFSDEEIHELLEITNGTFEELKREFGSKIAKIGFYSGSLDDIPDAGISINLDEWPVYDGVAMMRDYVEQLIEDEEIDTPSYSHSFEIKGNSLLISGRNFLLVKGTSVSKSNGKTRYSVPITHYITYSNEGILRFTMTGKEEYFDQLEKAMSTIVFQ